MTDDLAPLMTEKFRAVERDIARLEGEVRVLMPLVGQMGVVQADVEAVERALDDLRMDLREYHLEAKENISKAEQVARDAERQATNTATEVLRSGRSEMVKFISILVGAFATIAVAVIGAYAKGIVGP